MTNTTAAPAAASPATHSPTAHGPGKAKGPPFDLLLELALPEPGDAPQIKPGATEEASDPTEGEDEDEESDSPDLLALAIPAHLPSDTHPIAPPQPGSAASAQAGSPTPQPALPQPALPKSAEAESAEPEAFPPASEPATATTAGPSAAAPPGQPAQPKATANPGTPTPGAAKTPDDPQPDPSHSGPSHPAASASLPASASATPPASPGFQIEPSTPPSQAPSPPQSPPDAPDLRPATVPTPHADPPAPAAEDAIRIAIGGAERLDIRIDTADRPTADKVASEIDLLHRDLAAIGSEVEAIRVEVRNESAPDTPEAPLAGRHHGGDGRDALPQHSRRPEPDARQGGRQGEAEANERQGQKMHIILPARTGQIRKVDRYA